MINLLKKSTPADRLLKLLQKQYDLVQTGQFVDDILLANIEAETNRMTSSTIDESTLLDIQRLSGRIMDLLSAAQKGVIAARKELTVLREDSGRLQAYDRQGRLVRLDNPALNSTRNV